MEYKVLSGSSISELENKVNKFIKKGFVLQGGVSLGEGTWQKKIYLQAMIKE